MRVYHHLRICKLYNKPLPHPPLAREKRHAWCHLRIIIVIQQQEMAIAIYSTNEIPPFSNIDESQRWQRQLQLSCHILCANIERMKIISTQKRRTGMGPDAPLWARRRYGLGGKTSKNHAVERWNTFVTIESSILQCMVPKGEHNATSYCYRNEVVEVTRAVEILLYRSSKSNSNYTSSAWVMTAVDRIARVLAAEVLENYSRSARYRMMRLKELQVRTQRQHVAVAA